ncbi:uncharacterized protein PV09_03266 [Verruconis gallopava]|uniref:Uncharacterized protein n=1 Tax=Verruconis gallopava TaxID=253628 RepID=A0A0D1YZH7_9PEZI|nr:uncharacterized protein PV09_03266 [Verruconis gallopava]KIW06097.1 hypothetical protein PV09_03266 [Verruconis gallopava]
MKATLVLNSSPLSRDYLICKRLTSEASKLFILALIDLGRNPVENPLPFRPKKRSVERSTPRSQLLEHTRYHNEAAA